MQLFNKNECISICLKNTNKYVRLAVEDMRNDFKRISESGVMPEIKCNESDYCIIIEENTTNNCEPLKDEGFTIKSENNKIRISANGYLGTMWGIYTFCEEILGVEPCYLFNDLEITKRNSLEISDIDITEKPESFGFRGVFINDEDLLTGWKNGGGIRYLDFPWYSVTVDEKVIDMVVETVLRLKLNLVIPASFLDVDNPPEKLLADCVAKRGIYLSQHHLEPLGLSSFTFGNYCRRYDRAGEFSYIKYPEVMEEAWEFYAKKWAEYDNVVWQIGLRGEGDRPMWQEDNPTDEELKKYGKFISKAYAKQKEIVMKATDNKAKYFTTTWWMDCSLLTEKGCLDFPENATMVFSDIGLNQMYGKEYYTVPRVENIKRGIYYHLQFFASGPHLAPQTGLDKLYHNTELAYKNGDNSYFILNISNIREFVFEFKAYSEMMWDFEKFSKQEYLDRYCGKFGSLSDEAKRLITQYYSILPCIDSKYLSVHPYRKYFNFYSGDIPEGVKNFILKEGDILERGTSVVRNFHRKLECEICRVYYEKLKYTIPQYIELCCDFEKLAESLSYPLKKHVEVKWLLFAKTLLYIYKWYVNLYEAKQYYDSYDSEKMKASLNAACRSIEEYLCYRKCAEYMNFKDWYRGDLKINVKQKLYDTKRLLGQTPDFC